MTQRILTEAEREKLRANIAAAPQLVAVERPAPSITSDQRKVLAGMVDERCRERARMRSGIWNDLPLDQNRWDLLSRELTMLYVLLGEIKRTNPEFVVIKEPEKKAFWQECLARVAREEVAARRPQPVRRLLPRPVEEAYGA